MLDYTETVLIHVRREIDKSEWVVVAEAMVERWNVKFVDSQGIAWVPRLKPMKLSRKK
jgi:hypothetical protein